MSALESYKLALRKLERHRLSSAYAEMLVLQNEELIIKCTENELPCYYEDFVSSLNSLISITKTF